MRSTKLVLVTLFFVCMPDSIIWYAVPHVLRRVHKRAAKIYSHALKIGKTLT